MPASVIVGEVADGSGGPADTTHARLLVYGTPSGPLTFAASRDPEALAGARVALTATGPSSGWWEITLPTPGLWYVWLTDGAGTTDSPVAVWTTRASEVSDAGLRVRDILRANQPALDLIIGDKFNSLPPTKEKQQPPRSPLVLKPKIQQIIFGLAELQELFPAIVVSDPNADEPYGGIGYCRELRIQFEITVMIMHRDKIPQLLPTVTDMARGVQRILNQPHYEKITTARGLSLRFCTAGSMRSREDWLSEAGAWGAEATVNWSCQGIHLGYA